MNRVYIKVTQQEFNVVWSVLLPIERLLADMPQGETVLVILGGRVGLMVDKEKSKELEEMNNSA